MEQHGARFYDESRDPDITLDYYSSGDHVKDQMIPRYTEIFWKKVAKLVNPVPAP